MPHQSQLMAVPIHQTQWTKDEKIRLRRRAHLWWLFQSRGYAGGFCPNPTDK